MKLTTTQTKRKLYDVAEDKEEQPPTKKKTIDKIIPRKQIKDASMGGTDNIQKLTPRMKQLIDNEYIRKKSNGDTGFPTEYREHVENELGYKLSYGLYKELLQRLRDLITGVVTAEPTELSPEMKSIIDQLYEEWKGVSIRMMDYKAELE